MTNPVFPTLSEGQDSKYFSQISDDPAIRASTEGGYEITRRRYTRTPRKTFTSGFTRIGSVDKATLAAFEETVGVGSVIFDWTNPDTLAVHAVRFTGPINFKYVGHGPNKRWDVTFTVKEA